MDAITFKQSAYAHLAGVGKALASDHRLRLLELVVQRPHTVEELARATDLPVANTSHHLQVLKRASLVRGERDGQHVRYRPVGPEVAALLSALHAVGQAHVGALQLLTRDWFADRDALEPIGRDELLARLAADEVLLVDVRPEAEFDAGHVPGALSLPLHTLEARLADLPRDRPIVAYCRGPFCSFSADAATRLRAAGIEARRTDATVHDLQEAV